MRLPTLAQDAKSVEILLTLKRRMFADKKQNEFTTQVEELGAKHPESLPILEFWAALYNELNRESQYFEVLIRLFDANFNSGNFAKSSEVLERLVDIDSYDYRNQERLEKLRGRVDETFLAQSCRTHGQNSDGHAEPGHASQSRNPATRWRRKIQ